MSPSLNEDVWSVIFHLDKFVRLEHRDLAVKLLLVSKGVKQSKRVPLCVTVRLTWGGGLYLHYLGKLRKLSSSSTEWLERSLNLSSVS